MSKIVCKWEKEIREEICENCASEISGVCGTKFCDFNDRQIALLKRKIKEAVDEVRINKRELGMNKDEVLEKRGIKETL